LGPDLRATQQKDVYKWRGIGNRIEEKLIFKPGKDQNVTIKPRYLKLRKLNNQIIYLISLLNSLLKESL
jgi:hypothetical protein